MADIWEITCVVHSAVWFIVTVNLVSPIATTDVREATVGLPVTLPCNIGNSSIVAMWFSPTSQLLTTDYSRSTWDTRFSVPTGYQRERNLRISSVQTSDAGTYTCKQAVSSTLLNEVLLQINVPPTLEQSGNVVVEVGSDVTISCRLTSGTPEPSITWIFRGNQDEYLISHVGGTLTLKNVLRDQAGEYSCLADNGVPPAAKKTIKVDVLFAPTLHLPYRELRQAATSNALLTCVVDANPLGEVYWERGDGTRPVDVMQLAPSAASDIDRQPQPMSAAATAASEFRSQTWTISRDGYKRLVGAFVDNLDERDFGVYTCHARNKYGTSSAKISVLAFNDSSDGIGLPSSDANTQQSASTSGLVIMAALLALVCLVAVVLGVVVVKQRRDAGNIYETTRAPQIYKNCRS